MEVENSIGTVSRKKAFEEETPSEHLLTEQIAPPVDWPMKGEIRFQQISGICGRTGSGKSSVILSILRLAEMVQGDVVIDGIPIADMPRNTLRRSITVMPQDSLILFGTVRFNVDPFSQHGDEAIVTALEEVCGVVWKLLSRRGLDATLESSPLWRGQKQLSCLARAVLNGFQILILDEVTSNVDAATERKMMDVLRAQFADSTVISIAHHLQTVRDFDRILVLDGGRGVEWGHPDDLLGRRSKREKKKRKAPHPISPITPSVRYSGE
ncbi:hypothetical protein ASPZODRAFT_152764 [Penicilliopsis zonata CBS 506.65]|uniref:ABC transporter domain-containing protein n=1 Tax=Penicilliopsis zonata CBS 506.65 TaxID=1073090 RepID=A0A1L9SFB1_9EURO|nr:hypothetical protein ASPZODRAFT_152764 [Penicilliopsis zonata CBS 506.65]OJJ45767.1 hypothetical protein ASPZODRAFT_152764 [Penicilliopsis zonata CBS 506.65]